MAEGNLGDNLGKSVTDAKELHAVLSQILDKNKEISRSSNEYHDNFKKAGKEAKKLDREVENLASNLEDAPEKFVKGIKSASKEARQVFSNTFTKGVDKEIQGVLRKLKQGSQITLGQKHLVEDLEGAKSVMKDLNREMKTLDGRSVGSNMAAQFKKASFFAKRIKGDLKSGNSKGLRDVGSAFKRGGQQRVDRVDRVRRLNEMRAARGKTALGGGSKAARMAGGATKMAGSALGAASKVLGPVALIVQGLSKVNDVINSGNQVYTKGMQDYKALAGTQFSGTTFEKKGESFNDTIRDVKTNTAMGQGSDEWKSMFESMSQAGMVLPSITKDMGKLKDVMVSTRKTSLILGVSSEVLGEAMVNTSLETKAGLTTMQEGFEEVAQNAHRAGIESNRFLGVIQQSTLAMGAYGNFTKGAAATLGALSTNSGVTQTEAESMTGGLSTYMKDKSSSERLADVSMMGKGNQSGADWMKGQLIKERDSLTNTDNQAKMSDTERRAANSKAGMIDTALADGSDAAISNAAVYVKDTMGMILRKIDNVASQSGKTTEEYIQSEGALVLGNSVGLSPEMVEQLKRTLNDVKVQLKPMASALNSTMQEAATGGDSEMLAELRKNFKILSSGTNASQDDVKGAKAFITKVMESKGANSNQIKDSLHQLSTDSESVGKLFMGSLNANEAAVKNGKEAKSGVSGSALGKAALANLQDPLKALGKETISGTDKTIEALTPLQQYSEYLKDDVKWKMSSSNPAKASYLVSREIRKDVARIYKEMAGTGDEGADAIEALQSVETKSLMKDINARESIAGATEAMDTTDDKKAQEKILKDYYKSLVQLAGDDYDQLAQEGSKIFQGGGSSQEKLKALQESGAATKIRAKDMAERAAKMTAKIYTGGIYQTDTDVAVNQAKDLLSSIDDMSKDEKQNFIDKNKEEIKNAEKIIDKHALIGRGESVLSGSGNGSVTHVTKTEVNNYNAPLSGGDASNLKTQQGS